jgi:hypothetical protein
MTQANAGEAGLLAVAAEDDLIAVFEERPGFAIRQGQRLGSAPSEFEEAAAVLSGGTGDGSTAD